MIAIAALACVCGSAWAAPIGSNDVARAMGNWRHRRGTLGAKMGRTVKDVRKVANGEKTVYIVRFEGGGHLIAPTDTNIRPVIMFSGGDDFDPDPNNPAWDLIGGTHKAAKTVSAAPTQGDDPDEETDDSPSAVKNRAQWAELLDDGNDNEPDFGSESVDEVRVAPLTTTKWNQLNSKGGEKCYNYYTPYNRYCGCVATATAQILRKFAYMGPNAFKGSYVNPHVKVDSVEVEKSTIGAPYDWESMVDVPDTEKEREAVGHLTSDVGIMVGMKYNADGSGSKTYMGKLVFEKFFGYSSAMAMRGTGMAYAGKDDLFERMFVSNFDAKLPVQIALSGHSILGDGYGYSGGEIHYHLNFGWGGGGYWYDPPDDLEGYSGFVGAVYNIYTNQNHSAETVIASGRVTRDGSPVAGLRVSAAATDDPATEVASATTDEKGIYALFVPAGKYKVRAIAEQYERSEVSGETIASPAPCVSTIPVQTGYFNYVKPDEAVVGNAAHCDIALKTVEYEPEAEVTVGEVSGQTNFTCATIPVTAKVVHYGQTAEKAVIVVKLKPVGGGMERRCDSDVFGGFAEYGFNASFTGLEAGITYRVEVTVMMIGTDEQAGLGDGSFVEAREFVWFDESATSFTAAKWSGGKVEIKDDNLIVGGSNGSAATFTPEPSDASSARVVVKIRKSGAYEEGAVPTPDGPAAVSAVFRANDRAELVVWGDGAWHPTGIMIEDESVNVDVAVDLDFVRHTVRYSVNGSGIGDFGLSNSVAAVSSVSFGGYTALSELQGTAWDKNLVRAADGTEYANYEAAKDAGATGVLSPLWLSTWNLAGGSGTLDVKDPGGLIAFTGASKVLRSETQPDGSERKWYAEANDADIDAGAEKYIKTTVDLGLAKAITDNSVVKIGDYLVSGGTMSFIVKVDDETIARETIKNLVEVKATLADKWVKPSDENITFKDGKVVVTPNAGGASGFARVRVPADPE